MFNQEIKIGIHGPRSSGKTCYLAALYGGRSDGDCSIAFSDDDSIDTLKNVWQKLERGEVEEGTTYTKDFAFALTTNGHTHNIRIQDYPGELVQRIEGQEIGLSTDVKEWHKRCDAIIIFIDIYKAVHGSTGELRERADEIDLLINDLLSRFRHRIKKPVVLALTKWDVFSPDPTDFEKEKEVATEFLQQRFSSVDDIAKSVKNFSENFCIIPVSAFGGNQKGILPPQGGPKPFNTIRPFEWCVERVSEIRKRKWKKRIGASIAIFFAFLGLTAAFFDQRSRSQYASLIEDLDAEKKSAEDMKRSCEQYQGALNLSPWHFKRERAIRDKLREYTDKKRIASFETLEPVQENETIQQLDLKIKRYDDFLEQWQPLDSTSKEINDVRLLKDEANRLRGDLEMDSGLRDKIAALDRQIEAEKGLENKVTMIDGFLNENPESNYPSRCKPLFEELQRNRYSFFKAITDREWEKVRRFIEENPTEYSLCMDKLDEFKETTNDPGLVKAAEQERKRIEIAWDKSEYNRLRKKVNAATTYKQMSQIRAELEAYVKAGRPLPRMKFYVQTWLEAFALLEKGRDINIVITKLTLQEGGLFKAGKDDEFAVYVKKGDKEDDTGYTKGLEPDFKKKDLGPFHYRPNDKFKITVYRTKWGSDQEVSREIEPFSRDIQLVQDKQPVGRLILDFQDVKFKLSILPPLEEYKDEQTGK